MSVSKNNIICSCIYDIIARKCFTCSPNVPPLAWFILDLIKEPKHGILHEGFAAGKYIFKDRVSCINFQVQLANESLQQWLSWEALEDGYTVIVRVHSQMGKIWKTVLVMPVKSPIKTILCHQEGLATCLIYGVLIDPPPLSAHVITCPEFVQTELLENHGFSENLPIWDPTLQWDPEEHVPEHSMNREIKMCQSGIKLKLNTKYNLKYFSLNMFEYERLLLDKEILSFLRDSLGIEYIPLYFCPKRCSQLWTTTTIYRDVPSLQNICKESIRKGDSNDISILTTNLQTDVKEYTPYILTKEIKMLPF